MTEQRKAHGQTVLNVPNTMEHLPVVLAFVRAMAGLAGFDRAGRDQVELAVEEAAANVIKHAFSPGQEASFEVACHRTSTALDIRIRDMGLPFDPSLAPSYRPEAGLDEQTGKGLGSFLMARVMDEFAYVNLGPQGKETRLVKRLPSDMVRGEEHAGGHEALAEAESAQPALDVTVDIRWMRPAEAVEVSRCVWEAYGYTYVNEHIYYPERVAAMNRSGEMRSAVAGASDGRVAGHLALVHDPAFPDIADVAVAVVRPDYQGHSIARRLGEYLVDKAQTTGLAGLYSEMVTVHPFTQRFLHRLGFGDCGLLLAHTPPTMRFKGIAEDLGQRLSPIRAFCYLTPRSQRPVYAGRAHARWIERLFAEVGAEVRAQEGARIGSDDEPVPETTAMDVAVNASRLLSVIRVGRYGRDFTAALRREIGRMRRDGIQVAELYLNLADPLTPGMAETAGGLGFVFTGILPEAGALAGPGKGGGDAMVLQFFNGVVPDFETMIVESELSRDLLAHVREQMEETD